MLNLKDHKIFVEDAVDKLDRPFYYVQDIKNWLKIGGILAETEEEADVIAVGNPHKLRTDNKKLIYYNLDSPCQINSWERQWILDNDPDEIWRSSTYRTPYSINQDQLELWPEDVCTDIEIDLNKIRLLPSYWYSQPMKVFRDAIKKTTRPTWDQRKTIVSCIISTYYEDCLPVETHRWEWFNELKKVCRQLKVHSFLNPHICCTQAAYWQHLMNARIVISPWGYGASCWRDYEAIIAGCHLVKPPCNFVLQSPDIYNENYMKFCNKSDLADTITELLRDPPVSNPIPIDELSWMGFSPPQSPPQGVQAADAVCAPCEEITKD